MDFRKEQRGVDEILSNLASSRRQASQAKAAGIDLSAEAPREVYLLACKSIAKALEKNGFSYLKSGNYCRKKHGDFIFKINFQTSSENIRGVHVRLLISATVHSSKLKKWRTSEPLLPQVDYVAGGHLGRLQANHSRIAWDLADKATREEAVENVVLSIEQLALPYLKQFENLEILEPLLIQKEMQAMELDNIVEFLLCFANPRSARAAANNYFCRHPESIPIYNQEFIRLKDPNERSKIYSVFGHLALLSHAFDLGNITATVET